MKRKTNNMERHSTVKKKKKKDKHEINLKKNY